MTESENENDHFDLDHFDQLASLLTLGIAHASTALPSLNRSLDLDQMASLLTLGIAHASTALPSLNRSLDHFDQIFFAFALLFSLFICNFVAKYKKN